MDDVLERRNLIYIDIEREREEDHSNDGTIVLAKRPIIKANLSVYLIKRHPMKM
jgi:hypothetical protein